jgi:DNA invertase Pin-like site-specific DNA recombinase
MKAVILARVSSKEQEDGHSLDAQIGNLELYAERKGLKIIKKFTIIESSTKGERPEFTSMIDFVKAQKERIAVVIDTVDRLQRSFKETPVLNDLMERDCLELHFVKEGNVLSKDANSTQKLMWNMGVVMAQSYTDQLSDNVKRSIKHKINNGEWSGPAPIGYLNMDDPATGRKTVVPDPERAFLIKRLFQEYSTGVYSQAELIAKANGWGLATKKGDKVSKQTFSKVLQNPFYYGCMRIKGQIVPHIYTPLISKNLFDACQDIKDGRNSKKAISETKEPFLLRGLMKCTVSGKTITCDLKKGKYVYLICHDPKNPKKKMWIKEEVILGQIRDAFKLIQVPKNVLFQIMDHLKNSHESEKDFHHQSIKSLHKESEEIAKKQDRLTDLLLDESITKDVYNNKLSQLISRQQEVNQLLEQHHKGNEQFKIAISSLITLASQAYDLFESSTIDEKRQLLGYAFSNLELEGAKLQFSLRKPFDLFAN